MHDSLCRKLLYLLFDFNVALCSMFFAPLYDSVMCLLPKKGDSSLLRLPPTDFTHRLQGTCFLLTNVLMAVMYSAGIIYLHAVM